MPAPQPAAAFGLAALNSGLIAATLPDFAAYTCVLLLVVALLSAIFITPRAFTPGFFISTLMLVTAWRVAAMNNDAPVESVAGAAFLLLLVLQFVRCVINDLKENAKSSLGWFATLL